MGTESELTRGLEGVILDTEGETFDTDFTDFEAVDTRFEDSARLRGFEL